MEFTQVDVFCDGPYTGNPLAVFHEAAELSATQMQDIAREMNLSETSFVISASSDSYNVRIFTPDREIPFAGHPTIGTAWTLLEKGILKGEAFTQASRAGETPVRVEGDRFWMERPGTTEPDLEATDPRSLDDIARALGIDVGGLGLEARELGRSGRLRPAFAHAGLRQLMVPLRDVETLSRCTPPWGLGVAEIGAYCFTAVGAGRIKARGFWPGLAIPEDPATGSAAAGLGLYLAGRLGDIEVEVIQGEQIGRPSRMFVRAEKSQVRVGGRCAGVFEARLRELP
ncbi:MAG: PhzF family phenazine biosynthesis protein [Actinomycetota bacterium]|nr:PhzF family phenazine biosynthesis protein [Actinomycetota bacterium]